MTDAPKSKPSQVALVQALRSILGGTHSIGTQEALCDALAQQGFTVTQSSLSRLLRKVGVVKVSTPEGQAIYSLPQQPMEAVASTTVGHLVTSITHNETIIVIHTNPGCASLIASVLDHQRPAGILGTIAGDDTLIAIPQSTQLITSTIAAIQELLRRG